MASIPVLLVCIIIMISCKLHQTSMVCPSPLCLRCDLQPFVMYASSILFYYIKLKSRLSVCLSVCTFWHADNSAVSARIETGLARNESCVFEDDKVYFYKPIVPTVHRQECLEDEGVSSH